MISVKVDSDFCCAWIKFTEHYFIFLQRQVTSNNLNLSLFYFKVNTFKFHTVFMSFNYFYKTYLYTTNFQDFV